MKHTAVISLGSNLPCAADIVADAVRRLTAVAAVQSSSGLFTNPDDTGRGPDYTNVVLRLDTDLSADGLREFARGLEAAAGRTPESKHLGLMPLDIDIVIWDDTTVSPADRYRQYFVHGLARLR